MFSATGLVALVAVLAATAFGRSVAPDLQRAKSLSGRTMPSIERMTMDARNLPVQYFHSI
jgi:hypothetical protein